MTNSIIGLLMGFVLVLPGMSGGTILLIFGIYEQFIRDIAKLNLKPYIPLCLGVVLGIYLGGLAFATFFQFYRDATAAFLLGCLLASVKPVLDGCPKPGKKGAIVLILGIIFGFFLVSEAIGDLYPDIDISWWLLFIGGALSSAAMIVPGLPGTSVLILLGMYDTMLFFVAELHITNLAIFGAGSVVGILLLANVLNRFYTDHRLIISYLFAGLIIGSARGLIPESFSILYPALFLVGFALVWFGSSKLKENKKSKENKESSPETE